MADGGHIVWPWTRRLLSNQALEPRGFTTGSEGLTCNTTSTNSSSALMVQNTPRCVRDSPPHSALAANRAPVCAHKRTPRRVFNRSSQGENSLNSLCARSGCSHALTPRRKFAVSKSLRLSASGADRGCWLVLQQTLARAGQRCDRRLETAEHPANVDFNEAWLCLLRLQFVPSTGPNRCVGPSIRWLRCECPAMSRGK